VDRAQLRPRALPGQLPPRPDPSLPRAVARRGGAKTDAYLEKLSDFLRENVDADEIDRTGELPEDVVQGLRELGAFGMKIPEEYGGIGLSQVGYGRAIQMVTSKDGNLTALLSAHQSIGVPQPLKMFGTPEQKKKYLPRLAKGAISAFALTEPGGRLRPGGDDHHRHPDRGRRGLHPERREAVVHQRHHGRAAGGDGAHPAEDQERQGDPADHRLHRGADTPGVEVTHRCHFMGLKAIQNA
jgi:hypothetical protein